MVSSGLAKLVYGFMGQADMLIQPGLFNILCGKFQHPWIGIIAAKVQLQSLQASGLSLLRLSSKLLPEFQIMLFPKAETVLFPQQARGNIRCHHGPFNHQGCTAAHGIQQCRTLLGHLWPACPQQDGSGQVLLDRRTALPGSVTATVQALSGDIQGDSNLPLVLAHLNTDIRIPGIHIWTLTLFPAQTIDNGIFNPLGAIHSVVDQPGGANKVDSNGLLRSEMLLPGNIQALSIELICLIETELMQGH